MRDKHSLSFLNWFFDYIFPILFVIFVLIGLAMAAIQLHGLYTGQIKWNEVNVRIHND